MTNILSYNIGSIFSQITLEIDLWYLIIYYFQKLILAKICYKIDDVLLLATVKVFKN